MIEDNPFDHDVMAEMAKNITEIFANFDKAVIEAFRNPQLIHFITESDRLNDLRASNKYAANDRRKWRTKPSMVR